MCGRRSGESVRRLTANCINHAAKPSADCARVNDLTRLDRPHIGRIKGHDGNGVARQRRELNLVARALLMHQHDGANVTDGKPRAGQIALQHHEIQFIDHGVTTLFGTNVTSRGMLSRNSTNQGATREVAARQTARSAPKQFDKLLNSEACVGNDATERADPQLFVIGNDNPCVRLIATKHHVTAGLTAKDKPNALQGGANIPAR